MGCKRVGYDLETKEQQQLINNVVIVSGGQQRDSAIHLYVSILPQTPLPSGCHMTLRRVQYTIQYVLVGSPF